MFKLWRRFSYILEIRGLFGWFVSGHLLGLNEDLFKKWIFSKIRHLGILIHILAPQNTIKLSSI